MPMNRKNYKYSLVIQHVYAQQKKMYNTNTHSIEDRIVSIHQLPVWPIVRGKATAKVEFGAKINVSLVNGITFLDDHSRDAFNEGRRLLQSVEKYKVRFGCYPRQVVVDKFYCNNYHISTNQMPFSTTT